jgi:hypothetical protein
MEYHCAGLIPRERAHIVKLDYVGIPLVLVLALTPACSCGDDDGDGGTADASSTDGAPDPDGSMAQLLRSGVAAITETSVPQLGGISGAAVVIGIDDETTRTVPPVPGFVNILNSCVIYVYDHEADQSPPEQTDMGAITVTGTSNGEFACAFNAERGAYGCQSTNAAIAGGSGTDFVLDGANDELEMAGVETVAEMAGMYIMLNGFPDVPDGTMFPIAAVDTDTDTLTLVGVPDGIDSTGVADSAFATFVGVGPVPGGPSFLDDGTNEVVIAKAADDLVPAITKTMHAAGEGFTLDSDPDNDYYLPHQLPTDGSLVKFKCTGEGCGPAGSGGEIMGLIGINGATTDGDLTDLPPNAMPPPVSKSSTFACAFIGSSEGQISADAMEVLLGTGATRIQTSVGRFIGSQHAASSFGGPITYLLGHQAIGWTDVAE